MPLQNRVTPFSALIATHARGTLMGNRGRLHNPQRQIVRQYNGNLWIICLLDFKDRQRQIMQPNSYTELFFLDEATALAAGHRPCGECQRTRYRAFREAWMDANPERITGNTLDAAALNKALHADRLTPQRVQRTYSAVLAELPAGTFVQLPGDARAWLWWGERLLPWSPEGYGAACDSPTAEVTVLTPPSTVNALAAGFVPDVHATARQ